MIEEYELLVIGGGIIGASCALEASGRGIKVLLVDKSDFGSETSHGSFKIVHGGLRYLQHLDFTRLRESVLCQNYIRRFAPNLVKPLPFIVPCYGFRMKGKEILKVACEFYNILSCDRNRGVSEEQILPRYKTLSTKELLEIAPYLDRTNLRGGIVFYDSQMLDPDRLLLQVILTAERQGAYVKNYTKVESIARAEDRYVVFLKDQISGERRSISARYIINAMGPWSAQLGNLLSNEHKQPETTEYYSKGIQLALKNFPISSAISIQTKGIDTAASLNRGGRAIFLQPWRNLTLLGTTDTIYKGSPENFSISQDEINACFKEVCDAYPDPKLADAKIDFAFGGLRAIDSPVLDKIKQGESRDGLVNTSRDEEFVDHALPYASWNMEAYSNIVSIVGIKYTTYRAVALRVLDCLAKKGLSRKNRGYDYLNYSKVASSTEEYEVILELLRTKNSNLDMKELAREIWETYGNRGSEFVSCLKMGSISDERQLRTSINNQMVLYSIQNEHAKTIEDILLRRFATKVLSGLDDKFAHDVGEVFGSSLGWDANRVTQGLECIK